MPWVSSFPLLFCFRLASDGQAPIPESIPLGQPNTSKIELTSSNEPHSNLQSYPLATSRYHLTLTPTRAGPLCSALLFLTMGDSWTRPELRSVFFVGISLSAIPALIILFIRDKVGFKIPDFVPPHPTFALPSEFVFNSPYRNVVLSLEGVLGLHYLV